MIVSIIWGMIGFLAQGIVSLDSKHKTNQVLVGILAQPSSDHMRSTAFNPESVWSYVAGSYVDFVSQSGAMPVLIPYDVTEEHLDYFIDTLDMFLLPGGGAAIQQKVNPSDAKFTATEFQLVSSKIIKLIKQKNDKGKYFPLLATCLGFESLIISENGDDTNIMTCDFEDEHKNHTIKINENGLKESKFWSALYSREELNSIFNNEIVYYTHHCGFTPASFQTHKTLPKDYHLIGTSFNEKGREFIASIEHKKYPIIGNQWHPEKNQFERIELYTFLDRSINTVMFMSKMIGSMVEKVRPTAKSYSEIPAAIKPYFSVYRSSEALPMFGYERIYTFERNSYDKKPNTNST